MVERDLAKVEVAGSKPVSRSSFSLDALNVGSFETSLWNLKVCNADPLITLSLKH